MDDTTTTWLSWRYELMHDFTIVVLLGLGLWKVVDLYLINPAAGFVVTGLLYYALLRVAFVWWRP